MTAVPSAPAGFRGTFLTDEPARSAYSEGAGPYRIVPSAVAIPEDVEALAALVRHAVSIGVPLTPRGAGSGIPGGNVGRGIVVDLRQLDHPLEIAPDGIATVGAAVTWAALDGAAAPHGWRFAPDPSSKRFCSVGGMVATNAAGARSVQADSIRPWVRALDLVTADGETATFVRGTPLTTTTAVERRITEMVVPLVREHAAAIRSRFPHVRKNSSGYALDRYLESGDAVDLVIGSEGTLGLITRVRLRLEPRPEAVAGALLAVEDLDLLGEIVEVLLALDPAAVEFLDRTFLEIAGERERFGAPSPEGVLLVDFEHSDFDSAGSRVTEALRRLSAIAPRNESALTEAEHDRLWELRHAASPVLARLPDHHRSLQIVEDGCVPVNALGRYVRGVREAANDIGLQVVAFGHAGDGHLHVNALADVGAADFEEQARALWERVTDLAIALGGTPTGEHGDGRLRAPALERLYGPEVLDLFRVVKRAFDPHGIFNPGVILCAAAADPLADLKVGAGAARISAEIASRLRTLERAGAWDTPPLELLPGRKVQ